MSKPTPRPWKRYDNTVGPGADDSWRITAFAEHDIAKVRTEADAAHIVECVNMHEELVNFIARFDVSDFHTVEAAERWESLLAKAEGRAK